MSWQTRLERLRRKGRLGRGRASTQMDQQNQGSLGFRAVVTFESDKGDPICVRFKIVDSEPDTAARKAVFRALPYATRIKYASVVIVLDRLESLTPAALAERDRHLAVQEPKFVPV
jgi:hypothetical protein